MEAGDAYVVTPPGLLRSQYLPPAGVVRLLSTLVEMCSVPDPDVCRRVATALADMTKSWPTLDPSQLSQHRNGTGLITVDVVRRTLLGVLKRSREPAEEGTALAILERLRRTDFREPHPAIIQALQLGYSRAGTAVSELFTALLAFYPTRSYAANEQCELLVYEQFADRKRGAGEVMERVYGPKLRYSPLLARMLKKGLLQADYRLFEKWYPGEDEPC